MSIYDSSGDEHCHRYHTDDESLSSSIAAQARNFESDEEDDLNIGFQSQISLQDTNSLVKVDAKHSVSPLPPLSESGSVGADTVPSKACSVAPVVDHGESHDSLDDLNPPDTRIKSSKLGDVAVRGPMPGKRYLIQIFEKTGAGEKDSSEKDSGNKEETYLLLSKGAVAVSTLPSMGCPFWQCIDKEGWLGFRNLSSIKFLGHPRGRGLVCEASDLDKCERVQLRPHAEQDDAFAILLAVAKTEKWKVLGKSGPNQITRVHDMSLAHAFKFIEVVEG